MLSFCVNPNGRSGLCYHRYKRPVFAALAEYNHTVGKCKQGVILANAHILARVMLGAALTYNDVAGNHLLTAINLDAQSFAF